jgi:hypothetical protein
MDPRGVRLRSLIRDDVPVSFRFNCQTARGCGSAFSRRDAPELCVDLHAPKQQEGAGKTGCALHPRSRVQLLLGNNAHEHTGSAEAFRPSQRNGFTAYNVLSPVSRALLPPSLRRSLSAKLGASVGRQNDTPSPSARVTLVSRNFRVHRIPPHVRDDSRSAPLIG